MDICRNCGLMVFTLLLAGVGSLAAAELTTDELVAGYGEKQRPLWTSSRVVGTPGPRPEYTLRVAYPELQFNEPLSFAPVPGTDRVAIAERGGRIVTFDRGAPADSRLLLDVGRTVYGIALHPGFSSNGRLYVTSVVDAGNPSEEGSLLSEFRVVDRGRLVADANTERVLLKWPSGGHNGGCLRFGTDGYLYLATGDASGIADQRLTGQDISDLPGSLLRIDVDSRSDGLKYGIPKDNPFIGRDGARPEIWSYGHRQVWKFSFDRAGRLWAGEVGQDLWEMIYLIQRGGNYGWSVMEGSHPFRPDRPTGPSEILKPVVEHPHSDFRSITGGFVYYGKRLPKLVGHYIYGDYDTGRIWALKLNEQTGGVESSFELCDEQIRLVEFGQTDDGEIYLVDYAGGQLHEIVPAPPVEAQSIPFPARLSETGLFTSTTDLTPAAGVTPYDVVAPLWSDHAHKERHLAVPGDAQIEFETVTYPQPAPGSRPGWRFPDGTVLVKTFSLETEVGNPASRRRLETRILHYERMPGNDDAYGAQVWHGYTYLWNDEQTDAVLADASGLDRTYEIHDASAPGGIRKQTWHFPSRAECTLCHTMSAKYALGVSTAQMNRNFDYGDGAGARNQLEHFNSLGLFTRPLPQSVSKLDRLADYHDETESIADRARSYLHANCSHCHRKWGGGNAEFQLLATLPLDDTGTVNVKPGHGGFDLREPRLIVPGFPEQSMIYHRMNRLGLGRMPHVASSIKDEHALKIVREWISGLDAGESR